MLLAALLGVSQGIWADTPLTIYCAVTDSELSNADANTVKANAKVQGNPETWSAATMTKTGATHNGVPVYSGTIQEKYGGVDILQIQLLKGSTWKAQKVACSSWKTSSDISGQIYVYSSGSWETYTPPAPCTTPTASNFTIGTSEYTYDGSSKSVSVTAKYGSPTVTVYYTGINGTSYTKSTTAPSAVGRYKVTVNTTAVSSYCAVSDLEVATLKIKKTVTVRVKKEGDYASTTPYLYSWYGTDKTKGSGDWPGSAMTLDGTSYKYQITIDAPTYNIIVSKNGSDQTDDIKELTGDVCYSITIKKETEATATKPTVTTTAAASITTNTATLGGNVTDAGQTSSCGAQTVTARGIEWVSGTGKTAGAKEAASAGGTGSFTVNVTGLTAGTTYTYRAYATNATGTSYGSNKSFTTTSSCTTPTTNDINISVPANTTTLYLGTGNIPSATQTVTAACSNGNTYLWSASPTTYSSSSCWPGTATRVEFTSASSKSTTATFYHEGVYTATFAAGCGNTTDASKNAPIITVKPGHIYFDGPFFSGSNYDLTKHHLEIDKSNDEFVYEWTATSSNTVAKNDFIISVGNQCINATTSAYDIGNYADLTLNGLVIPDKDTSSNTNCNHNFRANIGTIAVGERLKLTISYTGVNSSGVPKYTVKLEKVCSNPTVQTVSGTATICDGSSTNVTVSSSQSNYTYKLYKGGSATSTTQAGTGSALNFSVSEAGAYTVHAYYTSGSDAYCKADMTGSATVTVTPTASIGSVTLSSSSGCIGQGLSATANSVELGGGTGAWSSSNTSIATVSSTGNITPKAAGSANITYTITDGCGGTKSAQTSLTVNPNNSVAGVTISLDKNNVCAGVSVQASKSCTPVVSPGATAQWYSSTAKATIDPSTGAITTNSGGTSNISYRVTGGCGSTVETSAQTLTIKSIPTLTPASSSVENFTPVRIGANEDVTWSVAEQAYDSYLFEQTARKTKFKGTVGAGANKTFTVNGTGANGCAGSATVTVTKDNESCN